MNTKQLANVLIKILGLSLVAHSVPSAISAGLTMLIQQAMGAQQPAWFSGWFGQLVPMTSLGVGIVLMVFSRGLAAWLFETEDNA
jgi:hypothetical protein